MSRLFKREATVIVGDLRFKNDRTIAGIRVPGMRIQFRVVRTNESTSNTAEVSIFNLNATSRSRIEGATRPQFQIEAGYDGQLASLFTGEAVEQSSVKLPNGWQTKVKAADGFSASRQTLSVSLAPGASMDQAIKEVANSMKVSARRALAKAATGDLDGAVGAFANGISMSGPSSKLMDQLMKNSGADWSIQDGELQILLPDETTQDQAILLTPRTGLIGIPTRVIDEKRPKQLIVSIPSLLLTGIRPGRRIELQDTSFTGSFKATKVEHAGDTHGGDWTTTTEAIEV